MASFAAAVSGDFGDDVFLSSPIGAKRSVLDENTTERGSCARIHS
jgi:hypothetical protein